MAKERLKSPRARLFVALDLPEPVREGIVAWQREELPREPALRPTAAASLHMTLVFLGYHPEREVERIGGLVRDSAGGPVPVRLTREPVPVPPRSPRLYALGAESEAAIELQARVSETLAAAKLYQPEKRAFWPHVTVARARPESRGSRRPAVIEHPPGALRAELCEPFDAVRLTLYRSKLRPQGAEYTPMTQVELPRSERQRRR